MKLIAGYLEHAIEFERMANEAEDVALKERFLKQAADYHRLAEKRALRFGMPKPPPPSTPHSN
jgi:hypothetical protein